MTYIDANVFIAGIIYEDAKADAARAILHDLATHRLSAITSTLTLDEVLWCVWKEKRDKQFAITKVRLIMNLSGLRVVSATSAIFSHALDLMERYPLKPRDAIHAATALAEEASTILSDDADFDAVKELHRKPL